MKKNLYTLLFMAVALFSAATMVSCGGDDDEPEPKPIPQAENYARYTAKFSEDIFEFFDVTLTIEVDGKKDVYHFDETKKVDDMHIDVMDTFYEDTNKAGRVVDIPVFKFDVHPIRFNTEMKLTEAGKQKIANAKDGEEMDFVVELDFGECTSTGAHTYDSDYYVKDLFTGVGTYVKDMEAQMKRLNEYHAKNFDKTFKR